ncbi:MAG TPA: hypothetical protein VJX73_16380 [Terracidiphilus sp.]|nr:hypothetical protein [Terracidiphilus sp.]
MIRMKQYVYCGLLALAALCLATVAKAQSPFDGTWKTDLSQTKFSPKPLAFYISQGWYHCVTCNPTFDVAADGQDHAVTGQSYDTISVTIVDPHTISIATKKGGQADYEQTRTVSADGKTLTVKSTGHPVSGGAPTSFEATAKRSGMAPAGVHATSGKWVIQKETGSENGLLVTYKTNGDQFTMTSPTGETYTAKFDGADYPVTGAHSYNGVSLKKINANTIEETDKRDGKVIDVSTMTISANGKMMTIVDNDNLTGRTSTYVAKKQ